MSKVKDVPARIVLSEPGDGTQYNFILAGNGENVIVSSISDVDFKGCSLSALSVFNFAMKHKSILLAPRKQYKLHAIDSGVFDNTFLKYVVEKCKCNEYTALAAIICVVQYVMDTFRESMVIDKINEVINNG